MANQLLEYWPETSLEVEDQLASDYDRWGEEWIARPIEGQEDRIYERFDEYYDDYDRDGTPIPWHKIIGLAHIALTRERHA